MNKTIPTQNPLHTGTARDAGECALTMSEAMAGITRYHDYLWSFVRPALGERVMEIGVGFGQYTLRMLAESRQVLGCDLDARHLEELRVATNSPNLRTQVLDLEDAEPARRVCEDFSPDTVILLNVLEHVRRDEEALRFLHGIASPEGRLVLIVPALQALYNGLDREAGHCRRYTRASLTAVVQAAGWKMLSVRYINLPGVPGWLLAGWLGRSSRSTGELNAPSTNWLLKFYDRFFVGLSGLLDPFASRMAGLSVVILAQKSHATQKSD